MAKRKTQKTKLEYPGFPGVLKNNVVAEFHREMHAMIGELEARRKFDAEIAEWLKLTGNTSKFEDWRAAGAAIAQYGNKPDGKSV